MARGGETNGARTVVTAEHRASEHCHPSGICCASCAPALAEAIRSRATGLTGCGQGGRRLENAVRPSHTRSCRVASTVWGPQRLRVIWLWEPPTGIRTRRRWLSGTVRYPSMRKWRVGPRAYGALSATQALAF